MFRVTLWALALLAALSLAGAAGAAAVPVRVDHDLQPRQVAAVVTGAADEDVQRLDPRRVCRVVLEHDVQGGERVRQSPSDRSRPLRSVDEFCIRILLSDPWRSSGSRRS